MNLTQKSVADRIKSLVAQRLSILPERVVPTARFIEDLGVDSLDSVRLIMSVEEEFSIDISDAEALKLHTLAEMIAFVEKRLAV